MKKTVSYILGTLFVLSFLVALLFTSIELAAFTDMGFYKSQYEKNDVYRYVNVSQDELMDVTKHLLGYMKDKEEDLTVYVDINGEEVEFFNQREKDHMVDVKNLVMGAIYIGRAMVVYMVIALFILYTLRADIKIVLSRCVVFTVPFVAVITGWLAAIISRDFTGAFIVFHELLFTNDLWLLNPETDRLINMVPEPFFSAVTLRIGIIFGLVLGVVYIVSFSIFNKQRRIKTDS